MKKKSAIDLVFLSCIKGDKPREINLTIHAGNAWDFWKGNRTDTEFIEELIKAGLNLQGQRMSE